MEIFESLEVRWFFDASASVREAVRWFDDVEPEPTRSDDYLLTGRADLGLKVRAPHGQRGKFENKYLRASLGCAELAPRMVGTLERWSKLSLSLDEPGDAAKGRFQRVDKSRRQRRFAYDGQVARRVEDGAALEVGCGLELTRLRFERAGARHEAITLGLEAYGPEQALPDVVRATLRAAHEQGLRLEAPRECSLSYPAWLLRISG